jgi:coiled-coil domain-containing protein 63/114
MRIADEHMTQRIALRAKHDEDKEHFEQQIKIMQDKLTDRDETKDIEDKQADQNYEQANMEANNNGDYKNPMEILKMRLAKIIATNKEKNKLMQNYLKNVKVIEDAFEQIKEATGIQHIDEIVTSFIKAEEQIYALINYVNTLGTETD